MSAARRADPFGVAALAGAGTLAAHQLGYLTDSGASARAGVSHAYFGVLGPVVVLTLCATAWIGALRVLRRDAGRAPSLALLAGVQVGLFAAMEIGERVTTGSTSSLLSVPVSVGLVLQPLVAWVALRLLSAGRHLIETLFVEKTPALPPMAVPPCSQPVDVLVEALLGRRPRLRGPPVV